MNTRTGKIARLPREIREQLNRRLQDGEPGKALVEWLNTLREVQAVVKAEFAGRAVREQNLSEWKQGGYRDWLAQQEALEMVRRLSADADELKKLTAEPLTDKLAVWVTARYAVAAKSLSGEQTGEAADWNQLRELCNDVVALRRGDHYAERLRIERERLEFEQSQVNKKTEADFQEWAKQPAIRDKICQGFKPHDERIRAVREKLFGCLPDDPGAANDPSATTGGDPAHEGAGLESDQIRPNPASTETRGGTV